VNLIEGMVNGIAGIGAYELTKALARRLYRRGRQAITAKELQEEMVSDIDRVRQVYAPRIEAAKKRAELVYDPGFGRWVVSRKPVGGRFPHERRS